MPAALIAEMMFITLCDFFAKRYRTANLMTRFIAQLFLQQFIDMLGVVECRIKEEHKLRHDPQLLGDNMP